MKQLTIMEKGRATARVGLYWITFIGLYMIGGFISSLISNFIPANIHFPGFGNWISGTLAAFFATWLFLKWEKSTFASIGLCWAKTTLLRFLIGFLPAMVIFLLMVLILSVYGGAQLQRIPWKADGPILIAYLTIIPLGIMEEVAFRSYSLIRLNQIFGVRLTLLITATAFALYHVSMGWSFYLAFQGPFVWSFVYGLAAMWSRGIALPAGIHISFNLLQSMIGVHGIPGLFWKLTFPENDPARIEFIILSLQFALLITAIIAMEIFIRRNKENLPSLQP